MGKVIAPDPERVASAEPQEVPPFGVFPRPLKDDPRSEAEWKEIIDAGAPLKIVEARSNKIPSEDEKAAIAKEEPQGAEASEENPPATDAEATAEEEVE